MTNRDRMAKRAMEKRERKRERERERKEGKERELAEVIFGKREGSTGNTMTIQTIAPIQNTALSTGNTGAVRVSYGFVAIGMLMECRDKHGYMDTSIPRIKTTGRGERVVLHA